MYPLQDDPSGSFQKLSKHRYDLHMESSALTTISGGALHGSPREAGPHGPTSKLQGTDSSVRHPCEQGTASAQAATAIALMFLMSTATIQAEAIPQTHWGQHMCRASFVAR